MRITLSAETVELADACLNHNILTQNYRDDARHTAIAAGAGADLLVSWNFKLSRFRNKFGMTEKRNVMLNPDFH